MVKHLSLALLLSASTIAASAMPAFSVSPKGHIYKGVLHRNVNGTRDSVRVCLRFMARSVAVKTEAVSTFTVVGGWLPLTFKDNYWGATIEGASLVGENPSSNALGTELRGGAFTNFLINSSGTGLDTVRLAFRGKKVDRCVFRERSSTTRTAPTAESRKAGASLLFKD